MNARQHLRDHVETELKRRTDEETPQVEDPTIVKAMVLDDYKLDQLTEPVFYNPDHSADALYASYRVILTSSMSPLQVKTLNRVSFSKRGARHAFNDKSLVAVRLAYIPNRTKGLRVLSFSNDYDFNRRSKSGYEKPLDHRLLKKDRTVAKKFIEHSESLGLRVQFYSKQDGLIMSAQGSHTVDKESCMVVVEIATGQNGTPLFRHSSNHF
jgi:hypothetical protein